MAIIRESIEEPLFNDESIEKNNRQKEYQTYIINHVNNVKKAFEEYFLKYLYKSNIAIDLFSDEEFKDAIEKAQEKVRVHDASKWSDEEFDGYREKYYPTANELADPEFMDSAKERAEMSWEHHYKNNDHHQLYWKNEDGTFADMSLEAIIEMICDWRSFTIDKDPLGTIKWYESDDSEEERSNMSAKTKEITEYILYKLM